MLIKFLQNKNSPPEGGRRFTIGYTIKSLNSISISQKFKINKIFSWILF